jgi:heat shock protein HtpX
MTRFVNNIKTAVLLGLMMGLILLAGYFIGGGRPEAVILAFLFGGVSTIISFFFSDKIALAAMRGVEADPRAHGDLIEMVRRLAQNANLPMPKVYICPQEAPNAFATGRSPKKAAVAVTVGALRLLTYDELEGVMAHELAHVKNRDTLISTVAAVIAGAISALAYMGLWMGGGGNNREGGHPLAALLMVFLAPLAAALIQMAVSRSREFVADADGARIAGTPMGLINALRKLEAYSQRIPMETPMPTQNHMFIVEPFAGASIAKLFATHPPTEDRVRKLMELA